MSPVPINGTHFDPPESEDLNDSDNESIQTVSSISTEEMETYFTPRYGRNFHSHVIVNPYPLPVDDRELEASGIRSCEGLADELSRD